MTSQPATPRRPWLDVTGLTAAGVINSLLAPGVVALLLGAGMITQGGSPESRSAYIAANGDLWRMGWAFWFAVTLSFAWSYAALARHLGGAQPWRELAVGMALIAAAVDCVGIVLQLTVTPTLASAAQTDPTLLPVFAAAELLAHALITVAAFGLYTLAGLLLLPAARATPGFPRWLLGLGLAEWGLSALATALLVFAPALATLPLTVALLLFGPWVWSCAWWVWRSGSYVILGA